MTKIQHQQAMDRQTALRLQRTAAEKGRLYDRLLLETEKARLDWLVARNAALAFDGETTPKRRRTK